MSTELPPQQLLLQFCSAGHYLLFSSSAPFALPHFTTGNLKIPLPGFTEIPGWIISELSFRNNLHLDNGTKAAPTAIKSLCTLLPNYGRPPVSTLNFSVLSEVTKRIHTPGTGIFFAHPPHGDTDTLAHHAVIAVSILHTHLLQRLPIMAKQHKNSIIIFFFCKLAQIYHCFMQRRQEDRFSSLEKKAHQGSPVQDFPFLKVCRKD